MSHLIVFPEKTVVLPLRYYGNIAWYATMAAFGKAVIDAGAPYDKRQKAVHRCDIADTHGPVQLTVPVTRPHGIPHARWNQTGTSAHGAWWHVHRVTLESAYGRTPFFEFYIDRFLPFLTKGVTERYPTIADLDLAIDAEIRSALGIETEVTCTSGGEQADNSGYPLFAAACSRIGSSLTPYWQVRSASHGFIPGLSVLDLIFSLGPEAPLYLRSMTHSLM
ncbi:MAG: WbqC family protein [Muribaculaceae bacterium]|nr:WbqC family protein [Muribaculaceae bacterium]